MAAKIFDLTDSDSGSLSVDDAALGSVSGNSGIVNRATARFGRTCSSDRRAGARRRSATAAARNSRTALATAASAKNIYEWHAGRRVHGGAKILLLTDSLHMSRSTVVFRGSGLH